MSEVGLLTEREFLRWRSRRGLLWSGKFRQAVAPVRERQHPRGLANGSDRWDAFYVP